MIIERRNNSHGILEYRDRSRKDKLLFLINQVSKVLIMFKAKKWTIISINSKANTLMYFFILNKNGKQLQSNN